MNRAAEIAANLAGVGARIDAAARRAGRDPAAVTLVAVTKTKPLEDLLAAYEAGVRHFGENRVQEAEAKFPHLPPDAVKHLVGPIQSNKANKAARLADVLHAVDSADLARRLARAAATEGRRLAVYVEVNTGGEETKAGVPPAAAPALVEAVRALPELELARPDVDPSAGRHAPALRRPPAARGGARPRRPLDGDERRLRGRDRGGGDRRPRRHGPLRLADPDPATLAPMSWNTPEPRVVFAGPPGWSRLPNVTRALLVLTAAGYLAGVLRLAPMLLLTVFPERIWPALELWRLVTYPLVVIGIFNVLFGLLILWMLRLGAGDDLRLPPLRPLRPLLGRRLGGPRLCRRARLPEGGLRRPEPGSRGSSPR